VKASPLRGLYAITDEKLIAPDEFSNTLERTLLGGTTIIQYRDKSKDSSKRLEQASLLKALCETHGAALIINDDIELAESVAAHGVHLGKDDSSIDEARKMLGENAIIGISCYNQLHKALEAEQAGADYVAFGTMFASPTKPAAVTAGTDLITEAKKQLSIPVCAIGGIDISNVEDVVNAGADMTALISGLFATQNIQSTARQISELFR
jgi:thiamine-phosphate pyrophosphorylase